MLIRILPYSVAVKTRITDIVAEIKQIGTSTVSKFISFITTESELSPAIETFLAHPIVARAVNDGF